MTKPPNILLILIDDMGWMDLSCQGSTFYETPNIDSLAQDGVRFTNAYASCPVCSPTRASLMTGKYPARVGITNFIGGRNERGRRIAAPFGDHLPLEEVSIAKALKAHGYHTYHVGKWHLGEEPYWPEHHGFDVNVAGCHWGAPRTYFAPYSNPRLEEGPEGEYLTDRITTEAIKLIENNGDAPFFMFLSHYAVHIPIQVPVELKRKYEKKAKDLGLDTIAPFVDGELHPGLHKRGQRVRRRLVQSDTGYAAMVENLDWNIGRVLDTLDRTGLRENTIVFFYSDNGGLATAEGSPTCNLPLSEGKGWMNEGGTREPLLVRWCGTIPAGTTCNAIVTTPDFYPTILDCCGIPQMPGQHVDGKSFREVLLDPEKPFSRGPIFWHYPHYGNQGGYPYSAVRDGGYKLVFNHDTGSNELYDLHDDISETRDLAASRPDVVSRLSSSLEAWKSSIGAKSPALNPDWPQALSPRFVSVSGPMILDEDGNPCLSIPLTPANPEIYPVPIAELIEDCLDKEVHATINDAERVGTFHLQTRVDILLFTERDGGEPILAATLVEGLVGKVVSISTWLDVDEEGRILEPETRFLRIGVAEDPSI